MNRPKYARVGMMWMLAASLASTAPAIADDRTNPPANRPAPPPWRAPYLPSLPPTSPLIRGGGTPFGTAMIPAPTPPDRGGWPVTSQVAPAPPVPAPAPPFVNRPFLGIGGDPQPEPEVVGVLTPRSLPAFLSNLGYEVKTDRGPGDALMCSLKLQQGTWSVPVQVSFSKDRSQIWLVAPLRVNLPEADAFQARALARLLAANDEVGPMHFALAAGGRTLNLNLCFENRDLTPVAFRSRLDLFARSVIATEPLWNGPEWAVVSAPQ